jgi:hypothetical protein
VIGRFGIYRPGDVDAAGRYRQGAELGGVGAKFVERHRNGYHGSRCHPNVRSFNSKLGRVRIVEGFGGAADDLTKIGAGPAGLQQEVVSPPERQQPPLDRVLRVLDARCVAQALRGDRADGRQRVLDAVVELFEDQLLQLVGRLALLGFDAGLGKQSLRVDFGLREKEPKTYILSRQEVLGRRCRRLGVVVSWWSE